MSGDIPPFDDVNELWDEDTIRNKLNLPSDCKTADYYYHYKRCTWVVLEAKGSKIGTALSQLESTVKELRRQKYRVDRVIIVLDEMSIVEKKKFERGRDFILYEKRGSTRKPGTVQGISVWLIYRREFPIIRRRGSLWVYM